LHKQFIDNLKKIFDIKVINIKRNPSCDFLFDEQFDLEIYKNKIQNFLNIEQEYGSVRFEDFLVKPVYGLDITEILDGTKFCLKAELANKENLDIDNLEAFNDLAEHEMFFSKLGYTRLSKSDIFDS